MNGEKLLKLLVSFLIIAQVLGFVFKNNFFYTYAKLFLPISIIVLYFICTKKNRAYHILVLLILCLGELVVFWSLGDSIRNQMIIRIIGYIMLFYFLYYNHKSFLYNSRDVFTLILGSSLYTVLFFITYSVLREPMKDDSLLGFVNLLLLYILLIVGAMHYINIRSEKSLWFFLSILNFAFSDFMILIEEFYVHSYELKVLILICKPLGLIFLVNYMITRSLKLKSEEFEGF